MPYRILPHDTLEIRKYNPCRRTIQTSRYGLRDNYYFVPLPYVVYFGIPIDNKYYGKCKAFSLAFAKADDSFFYPTPFYGAGQPVCVDAKYHFAFPEDMDLGEIITKFWTTLFMDSGLSASPALLSRVLKVDSFVKWSKLTPQQVVKGLEYGKHSLEDITKICHSTGGYVDRWLQETSSYHAWPDE